MSNFLRLQPTWFVQEDSEVTYKKVTGTKSGKKLKSLDFTIFGDAEKIDGRDADRFSLVGELTIVITDMLDEKNIDYSNSVFGQNDRVHIDMMVNYADAGNNSFSAGFMRSNEEVLMEFLLDALEMGVVGRESVVSKEVTKVCSGVVGGISVTIQEVDE